MQSSIYAGPVSLSQSKYASTRLKKAAVVMLSPAVANTPASPFIVTTSATPPAEHALATKMQLDAVKSLNTAAVKSFDTTATKPLDADVMKPLNTSFTKPPNTNAMKLLSDDAINPPNPPTMKPLDVNTMKPLTTDVMKPFNLDTTKLLNVEAMKSLDLNTMKPLNVNADAQLAIAQGHALKQEVETHTAKLSTKVSRAMENVQKLLKLLRESLQDDDDGITIVNDLWGELKQLSAAAQGAEAALPEFLERQRNNMSLYHASMMHEMLRDLQDELNIQHKKVNIQHLLILEHQQAFQDYKSQAAAKLRDVKQLEEQVSRVALENTECDILRKALNDLKEEMKVAEQQIRHRYATELQDTVNMLKLSEANAKMEADKASQELKAVTEKYVKGSNSNTKDASYWKDKYESLLASIE